MVKRGIWIFLVFSTAVGPCLSRGNPVWRRVEDRLAISGSKTYTLQSVSVNGNRDMFFDDNYGFSPRYRNETNLTITGSLVRGLSLTGTFSNNRWNPDDRSLALNYDRGRTKASLGDITASLAGNELVSFSRRLRGAAITHDLGFCTVTAVASRTRAATKTVTLTGNNTPGPYYLGASQIVDGSERVKIDENEIPRSDASGIANYALDTFSGILTFRDGLIVPSTSNITVSFETQSYNNIAGSIWGTRMDVPLGKRAGIGFTYLTQASDHAANPNREITEVFHGNNSLGLPYELLYVPEALSAGSPVRFIVKVDGIDQMLGADYTLNYPLHYILFTRPIPSSSTILVTYSPKQENGVSGDRTVMGFDGKLKVSDNLTLTGQLARSTRDYTGRGGGGTATALRAVGKFGKLDLIAGLRNIAPSFASVETAGFFRNERGGNLDLRYAFSDHFNWFTRIDRFRRPGLSSLYGQTTPAGDLSTTQTVSGFEWKEPKRPQLRLSRTRIDSSSGSDWRDALTTDALAMSWDVRKINATGEISRSSRSGIRLGVGGTLIPSDESANTTRLSLRYLPGERFSLTGDVAGSKITRSGGSRTDARNYQLTAGFTPLQSLSLNLSYRVSDSGGNYEQPYGGYTGIGSGYPGSGSGTGSGGYPGGVYIPSFGVKSASRIAGIAWAPSTKVSIDTSYNYTYSEGANNTNTTISGMDFGFSISPIDAVALRGHLSRQKGGFIGSGGDMSSRIGFLMLTVGPIRKFEMDVNYQKMLSGTRYAFGPGLQLQDSTVSMRSLGAILRRDIGGGRYLFAEYTSSTVAGVIANKKSVTAFGIEYPLNQILGLKIDWRILDYQDARSGLNNYHASMLNAQIGARFR